MAAASIVNNSKTTKKEKVTLVKFDDKKETRKTSLADRPSGKVPAEKLAPITQQKKTLAAPNEVGERRRKISVYGPPPVS